jgi:hypothetical protein
MRWSTEQQEYRDALRRFVDGSVFPLRDDLERGGIPPYDILREYYRAFGIGEAALDRFERSMAGEDIRGERSAAETLIPMIELSRCSPGLVTALGVSVNLAAGAILRAGSPEQKRRWVPPLLTLKTVGAWAITEPDSGTDAFGSMRCTAKPNGDGWLINGSKTFITNGPYADTIVLICKAPAEDPEERPAILTFVLDRGMPGLTQTPPLRKMGLSSSPTGELALNDVAVGPDRLLAGRSRQEGSGSSREGSKATFAHERASIAAMALGIIERCLELSVDHARHRIQFGQPIGTFQLIQQKLAHMEVARLNVENLVLGHIDLVDAGYPPSLTVASAMKLYSAQVAMQTALEAVQIFGGAGYMAESHVEQLCRDAKVLQIYAGTDEIQITHVARGLLGKL